MTRFFRTLPRERRIELAWLAPLAAAILALHLASVVTFGALGLPDLDMMRAYAGKALAIAPIAALIGVVVLFMRMMLRRERSPLRKMAEIIRHSFSDKIALPTRLGLLLLMPVLFCAHGSLKMALPFAIGFNVDSFLVHADRFLFLGNDPWRLTHALFGNAELTLIIDRAYRYWVPMLGVAIAYFGLFARHEDRARFFLTFSAAWILLGVIGAYFGSSVGPCFLGPLGDPAATGYTELMARLHAIEAELGGKPGSPVLGALHWQQVLWHAYDSRKLGFAMGISAMPSMHVSIATIYVLSCRRLGHLPYAASMAFFAITLIGSVHLGWHYAVDGLASIFGTLAIWALVERYLKRIGLIEAERSETTAGAVAGPAPLPAS